MGWGECCMSFVESNSKHRETTPGFHQGINAVTNTECFLHQALWDAGSGKHLLPLRSLQWGTNQILLFFCKAQALSLYRFSSWKKSGISGAGYRQHWHFSGQKFQWVGAKKSTETCYTKFLSPPHEEAENSLSSWGLSGQHQRKVTGTSGLSGLLNQQLQTQRWRQWQSEWRQQQLISLLLAFLTYFHYLFTISWKTSLPLRGLGSGKRWGLLHVNSYISQSSQFAHP